MFWSHVPIAPWQDERWLTEMRRSLRPAAYLRLVENRFVSTESTFIEMKWFDECVSPALKPTLSDPELPIWVGCDASVKHDSTAIVATTWDKQSQCVRLIFHRIFQPSPDDPINFEATIEQTMLDLAHRFQIRKLLFDPFQMIASAQRLAYHGVKIEEYPQSVPNLTAASQNLFELLQARSLQLYPNDAIRLAMSRTIAVETSRGWRIAKEKQSHKIDVIVALAMSSLASVRSVAELDYDTSYSGFQPGAVDRERRQPTTSRRPFFNMPFIANG